MLRFRWSSSTHGSESSESLLCYQWKSKLTWDIWDWWNVCNISTNSALDWIRWTNTFCSSTWAIQVVRIILHESRLACVPNSSSSHRWSDSWHASNKATDGWPLINAMLSHNCWSRWGWFWCYGGTWWWWWPSSRSKRKSSSTWSRLVCYLQGSSA